MIDNENVVYDAVSAALRAKFDGIFITGVEITDTPPQFPAVSIAKTVSAVNERYSTFDYVENVASEEYRIDTHSNLESQRDAKEQTKEILAVIDGVMSDLFYIRTFCQPIPNADRKYTRLVTRYRKDNVI